MLGLLLFATFLGIPFSAIGQAVRDARFMATILVLNFVIVPAVVFALSRFVADSPVLLVGVLLVLLTPCIDYVIVFAGLAGGSSERLLAAAPLLMVAQMLLLPLYLLLFVGPELVSGIEPGPFLEALIGLIIIPLALAAVTQWWSRKRTADATVMTAMQAMMVPLMMATLSVVIASQIYGVGQEITALLAVIPLYVAFLVVMVPLGMACARVARLDPGSTRAVIFSGATRNSLVVTPTSACPARAPQPGSARRRHPDHGRTPRHGDLRQGHSATSRLGAGSAELIQRLTRHARRPEPGPRETGAMGATGAGR